MEMTNEGVGLVAIKDGLKALIVERLKLDIEPQSIKDDAPLFDAAEGTDGLSLDSVANEFYSVDSLAALVDRLLTAGVDQPTVEAVGA